MSDIIGATTLGLIFGLFFGILTTFWFGITNERNHWHRNTIERGLAQYCPNDGKWAWKGECDV